MEEFFKVIPIAPQMGAFVALTLIFLLFRAREMAELNKTLTRISDENLAHNKSISEENLARIKAIAEEFHSTVKDQNRDARASQQLYQQQIQALTDSHIRVSREMITAFSQIESAFSRQLSKLESVEQDVKALKADRGAAALPPPSAAPGAGGPPAPFARG